MGVNYFPRPDVVASAALANTYKFCCGGRNIGESCERITPLRKRKLHFSSKRHWSTTRVQSGILSMTQILSTEMKDVPRKLRHCIVFCRCAYFVLIPCSLVAARGFGMRVVGGKTGSDGRTFACIVWTVPGGPAEKAGLQQGDKVREHPKFFEDYNKIIFHV